VSCKIMSIDELDRQMPVNPPVVNKTIKPIDHSIEEESFIFEP